jgi:hypothetical protein
MIDAGVILWMYVQTKVKVPTHYPSPPKKGPNVLTLTDFGGLCG